MIVRQHFHAWAPCLAGALGVLGSVPSCLSAWLLRLESWGCRVLRRGGIRCHANGGAIRLPLTAALGAQGNRPNLS
jgi:hypothetical protein